MMALMTVALVQDPRVQTLFLRGGLGVPPFVESLVELEVLTNPLEIDVEIPEPLVSAEIAAEFSATVDVDSEYIVTIDVTELVVLIDIVELTVFIEECDI
jgi:hypothetical protein